MEVDKNLCISIATLGPLRRELINKINKSLDALNSNIIFLVVVQGADEDVVSYLGPRVKIVYSKSIGLSRSRNIAIGEADSYWIWFQDDDFELNLNAVDRLYFELVETDPDLCCLKIGSLEQPNKSFKNYAFLNWKSPLMSCKVSSIEILINRRALIETNVFFNVNLGLGTSLPGCEENLFLYSFILARKGRVNRLTFNEHVAYHTTDLPSRNLNIEARLRARGYFLSKLKAVHSIPLFFYWVLRSEVANNRLERLFKLLSGVKEGFNHK